MSIYFKNFPYKVKKKPFSKNAITVILNSRSKFSPLKRLFEQRIYAIKKNVPKHSAYYYQGINIWYNRHRDSVGNVECNNCKKDLLVTGIPTLYEGNAMNALESLMDKMEWWIVHKYFDEDYEYCNSSDAYDTDWSSDEDIHICPKCYEQLHNNNEFTERYTESGKKSDAGEKLLEDDTEYEIIRTFLSKV